MMIHGFDTWTHEPPPGWRHSGVVEEMPEYDAEAHFFVEDK